MFLSCFSKSEVLTRSSQTVTVTATATACAVPDTLCGSSCFNLETDPMNCGVCGNVVRVILSPSPPLHSVFKLPEP